MIEDQRQIEGRRTERAIAIGPAAPNFPDNVSVSDGPPVFAVTPDASRNLRGHISARAIALSKPGRNVRSGYAGRGLLRDIGK
jgi:hypothetical protein